MAARAGVGGIPFGWHPPKEASDPIRKRKGAEPATLHKQTIIMTTTLFKSKNSTHIVGESKTASVEQIQVSGPVPNLH